MSVKIQNIKLDLLEELSTEDQQLISGGHGRWGSGRGRWGGSWGWGPRRRWW
jgi:hypothetical protein